MLLCVAGGLLSPKREVVERLVSSGKWKFLGYKSSEELSYFRRWESSCFLSKLEDICSHLIVHWNEDYVFIVREENEWEFLNRRQNRKIIYIDMPSSLRMERLKNMLIGISDKELALVIGNEFPDNLVKDINRILMRHSQYERGSLTVGLDYIFNIASYFNTPCPAGLDSLSDLYLHILNSNSNEERGLVYEKIKSIAQKGFFVTNHLDSSVKACVEEIKVFARKPRPEWNEYFMKIAHIASLMSSYTLKEGVVLVDQSKRILSIEVGTSQDDTGKACASGGACLAHFIDYTKCSCMHLIQSVLKGIEEKGWGDIYALYSNRYPCQDCLKVAIKHKIPRLVYLDSESKSHEALHPQNNTKMIEIVGFNFELSYQRIRG